MAAAAPAPTHGRGAQPSPVPNRRRGRGEHGRGHGRGGRAAAAHHAASASKEQSCAPSSPAGSQVPTCPAPAPPTHQMLLEMLDDVHLVDELRHPVPTLQDVPVFLRAGVRRALKHSLLALRDAYVGSPDDVRRSGAWNFFLLTPHMLLARPKLQGEAGSCELLQRIQSHEQGWWQALLADARDAGCSPRKNRDTLDAEAAAAHRRELACAKVRMGELSRARHVLTAAELAPGNEATLAALTFASKRPPQAREPIPVEFLRLQPPERVHLSAITVARGLRACKRRSAPGLSGARSEHYKLLLDHAEALGILAQADVPREVAAGIALACITAYHGPPEAWWRSARHCHR